MLMLAFGCLAKTTSSGYRLRRDGKGIVHRSGSIELIRASLVRALLAPAALAAALALAGCYADDGYQIPTRAMKEVSPEMTTLLQQKNMPKGQFPDPGARVQGRVRARSLETGHQRTLRIAQGLSDLPLVGRSRAEGQGRRSSGSGRLLRDHAWPDQSEFQLLSRDQYRFPQRLRQGERLHRQFPDDPRRLFVARLLRDDRRADRRDLFVGA